MARTYSAGVGGGGSGSWGSATPTPLPSSALGSVVGGVRGSKNNIFDYNNFGADALFKKYGWDTSSRNKPTTGSSSSGGAYAGSSSGGGYTSQPQYNALDSYMSYINQQKEAEKAAREALKQQRIGVANSAYGAGMQNLNVATDSAMQQAYIKKMQEQRDLPQQMQAMGVSGGATESSMANLANIYGTNRTNISKASLQEQSALEQAKAAAIAAAESDTINNEMQANRDYSQGLIAQYASAMQNNAAVAKANSSTSTTKQPSVWVTRYKNMLSKGDRSIDDVYEDMRLNKLSDQLMDEILYGLEA